MLHIILLEFTFRSGLLNLSVKYFNVLNTSNFLTPESYEEAKIPGRNPKMSMPESL